MKPSEAYKATTAELLDRYSRLTIDKRRFEDLARKAKTERDMISSELRRERDLQSGWFILNGRKVRIRVGNEIEVVGVPKFRDIDDVKRKT